MKTNENAMWRSFARNLVSFTSVIYLFYLFKILKTNYNVTLHV